MELKYAEKRALRQIAIIKWGRTSQNFVCNRCKNKKINLKNYPISVRCTKCNKIESSIAHTVFAGSRIPASKKIAIIKTVYDNFPNRLSVEFLAKKFKVEHDCISRFFNKIWDWYPHEYSKQGFQPNWYDEEFLPTHKFFEGLNTSATKDMYYSIYALFYEMEVMLRPFSHVLEVLVLGDTNKTVYFAKDKDDY